jgi:ribonuclease P protein subunit RPR2
MSKPLLSQKQQKEVATERIKVLFEQAEKVFPKNKGLANRYVTLARKIIMKVRMRMPREYKRRYCKHCYKYLQPGVNTRVRTQRSKVIISCFECKKFMRIPVR